MARITLDTIVQTLAPESWQVISPTYTNLSTQMEFKCPEGHSVYTSWEKLRAKRECPVCKQNRLKDIDTSVKAKIKDKKRFLALDQASYTSGYAIFDGTDLQTYGIFQTKSDHEDTRIHEVKEWVISMVAAWKPDMIGIEGIQYQQQMGVTTFQTLARLQGVLIETCIELGIPYRLCPTNTWRAHCEVKGRTRSDKKASMQALVKKWFDISVSDDCADAIGIGKYITETCNPNKTVSKWE